MAVWGEEPLFGALTKGVAGPPATQSGFTVNPVMAGSGEVGVPGNMGPGSSAAQKQSAF